MFHVSESEMAKVRHGSVHKIIIFKLEHSRKEELRIWVSVPEVTQTVENKGEENVTGSSQVTIKLEDIMSNTFFSLWV